jgi:hypothetical protein
MRFPQPHVCAAVHGGQLDAQVGHPPSSSPYSDILYNISFTPYVGWIGGDGEISVSGHTTASFTEHASTTG